MAKKEEIGPLGKVYGSIITAPFKLANLPFKSYRQYYGKPKEKEEYTGSFIQKQRLKKVLDLMFAGKSLSPNDRLFMDMFNKFLTGESKSPIDQEHVRMNCDDEDDCKQYLFNKSYRPTKPVQTDDEEEEEKTPESPRTYDIKFNSDLKPKNARKNYDKGNTYRLSFLGKKQTSLGYDLYFRNNFLNDDDDFLIFRTRSKYPIGDFKDFNVYQDNKKYPLRTPIDLGKVSAKIS